MPIFKLRLHCTTVVLLRARRKGDHDSSDTRIMVQRSLKLNSFYELHFLLIGPVLKTCQSVISVCCQLRL